MEGCDINFFLQRNEDDGEVKDELKCNNETHENVSEEKEKVEENDEAEKEESKPSNEAECAENENERTADDEQKSPEENLEEKAVSEVLVIISYQVYLN